MGLSVLLTDAQLKVAGWLSNPGLPLPRSGGLSAPAAPQACDVAQCTESWAESWAESWGAVSVAWSPSQVQCPMLASTEPAGCGAAPLSFLEEDCQCLASVLVLLGHLFLV